jgi:hypothetical protein
VNGTEDAYLWISKVPIKSTPRMTLESITGGAQHNPSTQEMEAGG